MKRLTTSTWACLLVVGLVSLAVACTSSPCPEFVESVVAVPSGQTELGVAAHYGTTLTGDPVFSGTFPRGAVDPNFTLGVPGTNGQPTYDSTDYPEPAKALPSGRLEVNRDEGTVLRTYTDDRGRKVVEAWRFKEAP